ncbi:MAG: esterase-like activity of phytase family protein [Bacteroidota bacterium]|nr:esterase-like activity of phytase family protein [Bacteroidota bacterium]
MRFIFLGPVALALLLTAAGPWAKPHPAPAASAPAAVSRTHRLAAGPAVAGLRTVGSVAGVVPESSGLAPAAPAGTYYSFGDKGNAPRLFHLGATGHLLGTVDVGAPNTDWESLTRDPQGNYYVGDCGNNKNDRRDLAIYRFRPEHPGQVGAIRFAYPDQKAFPPAPEQRNFDVEASLWHDGKVWLFTKDRGQQRTSKVYTVPDQPGRYTARLVASLAIPGEVTDAALRPDGHRLVLLGRGELFVLDGDSWADMLKATPRQFSLAGAGQTEGATFKDSQTLLLTTEQGAVYEYKLP